MDGYRMRELRRISGLTQVEVAKEIGVTNQTIYRWENRSSRIKPKNEYEFLDLINDVERVSWIKKSRPSRVRGRPFVRG
jgi:transcriptional regulator with XRE-family HTH domain